MTQENFRFDVTKAAPLWRDDDGFIARGQGDEYVTIADVDCTTLIDAEEREAYKTLFIAAPAMLAALEADPTECGHKFPHLSACYCCRRDAAIALAKGEA